MTAIMEVPPVVPRAHQASDETPFGQSILDALRAILRRCEEAAAHVGFPGEGGERQFRAWLVSDLLNAVLGWPTEKIVVAEECSPIQPTMVRVHLAA
jgi:hypothetical protein